MKRLGTTIAASALVAIWALLSGAKAFAYQPWSPNWVRGGYCRIEPNASLLSSTDTTLSRKMLGPGLMGDLFEPKAAQDMRFQYEAMYLDYERRRAFDQLSQEDERAFYDRMSKMGAVVSQVRAYQVQKSSKRLRRAVRNEGYLRKPMEVVAVAGAIYSGQPMQLHLTEDAAVTARTDVKNQKGNLFFDSSLLRGSFDFVARAPMDRDPYGPLPLDPLQREERYRFAVSRGLGLWDLSSGLTYGSTTKSVGAQISKELFPNLVTSIGTTRYLRDGNPGEESVRFSYGLNF